jgi:hypothetical protein
MEKKHIFLIIFAIVVVAGAGFWLMATFSEPKSIEPITIHQPSGNFNCEDMYDEIENDLNRSNYCQSDSDCSVIMLGGWYVEFGCYHFINKDVDQEQFFTKMDAYKEKCIQAINKCAAAPDAKCVSNKCVYVD